MATVPNDTTKFELAWLIIWIILSVVLIALAALKKFTLPNVIKGDKIFSMIFTGLQLVIFVLVLAALAHNQWSRFSFPGGWAAYGVTSVHSSAGQSSSYDDMCKQIGTDDDLKNYCRTVQTAGAFTLIFGLVAIFTAFILLILVGLSLAGQVFLAQFNQHIPMLSMIQWIALQAMVIIWGVSGHDPLHQSNSDLNLGDSWAITFCNTIFAVVAALFFAGGAGQTATGATSAGPEPAVQPAATQ